MALLRYAAKFDPFLSLDCAPKPSTLAQSKERKGSNFAIWQPWRRRPFMAFSTVRVCLAVAAGKFSVQCDFERRPIATQDTRGKKLDNTAELEGEDSRQLLSLVSLGRHSISLESEGHHLRATSKMAKHYALWPSRYSDCTDPEKLNLMPFVNEDVKNLGEFEIFLPMRLMIQRK